MGDISLPMTKDLPMTVKNLLNLKLYGSLDILPTWLGKLSKLTKLDLMVTVLNQNDIQLLGELPDLTILRLHVMPVNEGNNNLDSVSRSIILSQSLIIKRSGSSRLLAALV